MEGKDRNAKQTEWIRNQEYLPPFLWDFHDQKRVLKRLQEVVEAKNDKHDREFRPRTPCLFYHLS